MDLKHAFRLCPVRRADWDLLGDHWAGQYCIDKRLPFGLRSSPALFHKVADAFEWILLNECGLFRVLHYLDDFFFAEPDEAACAATMAGVRAHAAKLGILLEPFKEVGPSTILTFLGVELDTVAMVARLPPDKLADLLQSIPRWLTRRKCIKCELQSIIGKLSFACKVVPAGRIFLRRLIDTASSVRRNHHHISLTTECKKDFQWWLDFLPSWNGVAMMLDTHYSFAEDMEICTDVSGTHGFGACYCSDWLRGNWEPFQTLESGKSIAWQELFAVVIACLAWGEQWPRKRVVFYCDNQSIPDIWQRGTSRSPDMMTLVRCLFLTAAKNNYTVFIKHIPGSSNVIADALSRSQMDRFRTLAPMANQLPTPLPPETHLLGRPDHQPHST